MPVEHLGIVVKDLDASATFYAAVLAPLGYTERTRYPGAAVGFGITDDRQDFWLTVGKTPTVGAHFAFKADSKEVVNAVYAAAIKAGAKDNGAAGPRPQYGPTYYGGFFFDGAENNVEAVYRGP